MGLPSSYFLYYDTLLDRLVLFYEQMPPVALKRFVLASSWFIEGDDTTLQFESSTGLLEAILHKKISDFLGTDTPTLEMSITIVEYLFTVHEEELLPHSSA